MRKLIIVNVGKSHHGKSSSIKIIFDKLKGDPNTTSVDIIENNGDIKAIITYKGLIIGVESQGDPQSRIFQSLDDFVNKDNNKDKVVCDIIIVACRTRGATYDAVYDAAINYDYDLIEASNSKFGLYSGISVNSNIPVGNYIQNINDLYARYVIEIIEGRIGGQI